MAILKIRDAEGNVQEVLAIKGDAYVLTDADKQEIAEIVSAFYNDAGYLTETQVLELIANNIPVSAEEVKY